METVEIRVFQGVDPETRFRLLPRSSEGAPGYLSFSCRVSAEEGYADASMLCSGDAATLQLTTGQRVAFIGYSDGADAGASARRVVLWDGAIARITPSQSEIPQFSVKLFGVWREAARRRGAKRYVNKGGQDLSVPFADLMTRFVATSTLANVTVITSDTGQTSWETLDGYDVPIAEAVRRLSLDSSRLVTGCDVGTMLLGSYSAYPGPPRVFLRPARATSLAATHTLLFPDPRTISLSAQSEDAEQASVLRLSGGPARFANLLGAAVEGNTSFEMPELPGASTASNKLTNGGFESGGTDWSLSGGATVKDFSAEGVVAYEGSKHLELDTVGEKATQTKNPPAVALIEGNTYKLRSYARTLDASLVATAEMRLVWLDSGGATISTAYATVSPADATWTEQALSSVCPPIATGFRVELELISDTGAGDLDGVLFDALTLYDAGAATQAGWGLAVEGSATIDEVVWDSDVEQWHSGRSVFVDTNGCGTGANQVLLRPIGTGNQQGTFPVVNISPVQAGFVLKRRSDAPATATVRVEVVQYKSDGTVSTTSGTTSLITGSAWTVASHRFTPAADAVSATLLLRFQSDTKLYVDAAHAFSQDAPLVASGALAGSVAGSSDRFIESDRYEATLRAADLFSGGSDEGIAAAALGEVWASRSAGMVKTDADAVAYAQEFFPGSLLRDVRVTCEVAGLGDSSTIAAAGCLAAAMPGETLRLLGKSGALLHGDTEVIQERSCLFDAGMLKTTITAGLPPRDPERRLGDAVAARVRASLK